MEGSAKMKKKFWERRNIVTDIILEQQLEFVKLQKVQLQDELLELRQQNSMLRAKNKKLKKKIRKKKDNG